MPNELKDEKRYAYTAIIEQIRVMIHKGELAPGDRLPPERRLAEIFGVSRHSLRQAFQALAERKIIESRQGNGTYLLATVEDVLPGDVILESINKHSDFLHDIIEFRQIIEPKIADLAARRITPDGLNQLKILVCDQQRALMAGEEDDRFDALFHQLLAESAGNFVIDQVMTSIQTIINKTRSSWLQNSERRNSSVEGHLNIINALEARNPEAAFTAMQHHITEIGHHIFSELQKD